MIFPKKRPVKKNPQKSPPSLGRPISNPYGDVRARSRMCLYKDLGISSRLAVFSITTLYINVHNGHFTGAFLDFLTEETKNST